MVSKIKVTVRKDFVGKEVTVGSRVIYIELGYRNFITGIITKMTDKKCTILNDKGKKNVQFYHQIIKANHG